MPPNPARRPALAAVAAVVFAVVLSACGGDEERVALAITDTAWDADGTLVVMTECATITEGPHLTDNADGPPTITIWGRPEVERCTTSGRITVGPGVTKVVDAATSQIVDLPPQ